MPPRNRTGMPLASGRRNLALSVANGSRSEKKTSSSFFGWHVPTLEETPDAHAALHTTFLSPEVMPLHLLRWAFLFSRSSIRIVFFFLRHCCSRRCCRRCTFRCCTRRMVVVVVVGVVRGQGVWRRTDKWRTRPTVSCRGERFRAIVIVLGLCSCLDCFGLVGVWVSPRLSRSTPIGNLSAFLFLRVPSFLFVCLFVCLLLLGLRTLNCSSAQGRGSPSCFCGALAALVLTLFALAWYFSVSFVFLVGSCVRFCPCLVLRGWVFAARHTPARAFVPSSRGQSCRHARMIAAAESSHIYVTSQRSCAAVRVVRGQVSVQQ